jgi:NAD(P)-dependent dehydrogenase (short-subunit alcohol dehydrogenase family)
MRLEGKVVLITGAATGIGRAAAILFGQEGAKVVIADIKDQEANETVTMIKKAGGEAFYTHVELTKVAEIEKMVKTTVNKYGKLDIFFHNAGIAGPGYLESTTEEAYDLIMSIHMKAGFFGAKYAAPEIRKSGGGSILFTSSGQGLRPSSQSPAYSVSKAGIIMLTRVLAVALAQDNIRVNAICPGLVTTTPFWPSYTSRNSSVDPDVFTESSINLRLIKRSGTAEEMALVALFLLSPEASYITGIALPIDGGRSAM